jgi:hypothetical protein
VTGGGGAGKELVNHIRTSDFTIANVISRRHSYLPHDRAQIRESNDTRIKRVRPKLTEICDVGVVLLGVGVTG